MPIRCFWTLSQNINRIQAQNDLRALSVSCYCQDGKAATEYRDKLVIELGKVYEYTVDPTKEKLDREGLRSLKALQKSR